VNARLLFLENMDQDIREALGEFELLGVLRVKRGVVKGVNLGEALFRQPGGGGLVAAHDAQVSQWPDAIGTSKHQW